MNILNQIPGFAYAYTLFTESDVVYRLKQEGYYFLIILLVFFIVSLVASNVIAYLFTIMLRLARLFIILITPKTKTKS
jgi:hypothetical protein